MIPREICGLDQKVQELLLNVFNRDEKIISAHLFGSRAMGNFKTGSDIDIVLTAPDLSHQEYLRLQTTLDDLLLPYKIDLILSHEIENDRLLEHIAEFKVRLK